MIFQYKKRPVAISSLDDMLLDAETPMHPSQCLSAAGVTHYTAEEKEQMETRDRLSEHYESCCRGLSNCHISLYPNVSSNYLILLKNTLLILISHLKATNEDCLILSPFLWETEGTKEPCRRRTFLRCNVTAQRCQCQDKFDLRWNTQTNETTYQWNPITKTCYVRGTNPCKQEVPCAPGTICRTTVSISYNTPPMQRVCECTDIELIINAENAEW